MYTVKRWCPFGLVAMGCVTNWNSYPKKEEYLTRRVIELAATCWEWPISINFFRSSLVRVRRVKPGYLNITNKIRLEQCFFNLCSRNPEVPPIFFCLKMLKMGLPKNEWNFERFGYNDTSKKEVIKFSRGSANEKTVEKHWNRDLDILMQNANAKSFYLL